VGTTEILIDEEEIKKIIKNYFDTNLSASV
jgi:hypothetical protein